MNDSFVFYASFFKALKRIKDDEEFRVAVTAIMEYALNGNEIYFDEDSYAYAAMLMDTVKPQIDANTKRRNDGKKGGRPKEKPMVSKSEEKEKPVVSKSEDEKKPNVNVNDNVNVNVNVNDNEYIGAKKFAPPTINDILKYSAEKNITDGDMNEAEKFIDFYSSKGWMIGKNKMKDWRSAWRGWLRRKKEQEKPKRSSFSNFQGRTYSQDVMRGLIEV